MILDKSMIKLIKLIKWTKVIKWNDKVNDMIK